MTWVATAVIGSAVIGGVVASNSAGKAADAANNATAAQSASAATQTQVAQNQLDFNKQVYADGAPARNAALTNSNAVTAAQLKGMQFATDQAASDKAYNEGTFRPVEKAIVADAQGYDTAQRRTDAAAAAQADVNRSFDATNQAQERDLERSGIAPGSGKYQSLMQDARIGQATSAAGAGTMAVRNVEQQGHARMVDAASLGRNLPANQATQQQLGVSAGAASTNAAAAGVAAQQAGVPNMNAGFAGATAANNSAGNLYGNAASTYNTIAGQQATGIGMAGQALGAFMSNSGAGNYLSGLAGTAGAMANGSYNANYGNEGLNYSSDENIKSDTGTAIDTRKSLDGINATPVKTNWKYDPAKGSPIDDGGRPHDGAMAQQVRKHMGESVAPGGKIISNVDMNAHLMAGMQEITKRMKKLEQRRSE